jgi:multimeric flavodoxin WrbA
MLRSTVALFGSSRRNGNTGQLMDRVARDLDVEVIDLASHDMSAYDYEHRNRNDGFERLMERVLGFDQIIFASPVYWYAVSPPMKVFLDRISDFLELPELLNKGRMLRGKRGFVVSTSIDEEIAPPFLAAFRDTFTYLGMEYGGVLHANCVDGYSAEKYEHDIQAFVSRVAADH